VYDHQSHDAEVIANVLRLLHEQLQSEASDDALFPSADVADIALTVVK
jgi:hypothetical protein